MFFLFPRLEHPAGWICARYKSLLLLLYSIVFHIFKQVMDNKLRNLLKRGMEEECINRLEEDNILFPLNNILFPRNNICFV